MTDCTVNNIDESLISTNKQYQHRRADNINGHTLSHSSETWSQSNAIARETEAKRRRGEELVLLRVYNRVEMSGRRLRRIEKDEEE